MVFGPFFRRRRSGRQAEDALRGRVEDQELAALVGDHDAVAHGVEDGAPDLRALEQIVFRGSDLAGHVVKGAVQVGDLIAARQRRCQRLAAGQTLGVGHDHGQPRADAAAEQQG